MKRVRLASLFAALFLSGTAALVYQTTWGRMLQRVFGVSDLAIATVLASFFLGLGLGSALGGRFASRLKRPAVAYALLEMAIGVWALLSLLIIPNVHGIYSALGTDASFGTLTAIRLAVALIILIPPTLFMGATLPILVKVVGRKGQDWSRSATLLYATNTLGAMAGAGVTGLYLLPNLGNRWSVVVAAGLSLAGGVLVLVAWRGTAAESGNAPVANAEPILAKESVSRRAVRQLRLATTLAALAGFAALASEVLWTRVLRIVVQGTTNAFAAMLVVYLFGIAAGSLLAARLQRTGVPAPILFGATQVAAGALTITAMGVAPWLPRLVGLIQGEPVLDPSSTITVFVLAAILLLPVALALGTSVPLAWSLAGGSSETAPNATGRILAANTLGGLVGSMSAGFFLVPTMGLEGSLVFGVFLIHVVIATVAFRSSVTTPMSKVLALGIPATLAVSVFLLMPSLNLTFLLHARADASNAIIRGPKDFWKDQIAYIREGRNTTVTVAKLENLLRLYNDGRPESGLGVNEPGFGAELATLGVLPSLFAEERQRAMVVGLGAGHTTTMLLAGGFKQVDVVELEEAVVDAARYIHEAAEKPFPLDDPKTNLVVDDARARLTLSPAGYYDAVVSQPSHPWLAGSSALYTTEFFLEVQRALKDGGVFALWVNLFRTDVPPLQRIAKTLIEVFPHAHGHIVDESSFVIVASMHPLELSKQLEERLRADSLRPFLDPLALNDFLTFLATLELDSAGMRSFAGAAEVLTDDKPSLEYTLATLSPSASVRPAAIDAVVKEVPWLSPESAQTVPAADRAELALARLREVEGRRVAIARVALAVEAWGLSDDQLAYVRGAVAAEHGHVKRALQAYDASGLRSAATAADQLRLRERMYWRVLQTALVREVIPWSASAIAEATFATEAKHKAGRVLSLLSASGDPGDEDYRAVMGAWQQGCASLLGQPATRALSRNSEHVARIAGLCAARVGDPALADAFYEQRARLRRINAQQANRSGDTARNGGMPAPARMWYRRALRSNAAHGPAAASLARLLSRSGDQAGATTTLQSALEAAEGLEASSGAIRNAARQLNIDLQEAPPETGGDLDP